MTAPSPATSYLLTVLLSDFAMTRLRADHQTVQLQERRVGLFFRRLEIASRRKSLRAKVSIRRTVQCGQATATVPLKMPIRAVFDLCLDVRNALFISVADFDIRGLNAVDFSN